MTATSVENPIAVSLGHAIILSTEEKQMLVARIENRLQHGGLVSFQEAADLTGLHPVLLRKLVRDKVLRGNAAYRVQGVMGNCDLDEARDIAARLQAARRPVEQEAITVSAAATKYAFPVQSIYSWQERGWVDVLGRNDEGDQLINEADIAFARALANLVGHKRGKPLLPAKE